MNISGQARLDSGSEYTTDTVWVRDSVSIFVRKGQSHVSEYVRVNERANVYKEGRFVGTVNVSGTVYVSGWVNGSWLRMDGSGTLDGSFYVDEN
jgi:hypothetical protein